MKIEFLLESSFGGSNPQFTLKGEPYVFKNDGNEIDGSFAIEDQSNGVVYAVDLVVNPQSGQFKITDIDVQDHGKTYDGDQQDAELVQQFIKANLQQLLHAFDNVSEDNDMRNLD